MNAFLGSILWSMRSGVVGLDPNLVVQSSNERAEDLWGLRTAEVRGR